jgi:hypothetical protein
VRHYHVGAIIKLFECGKLGDGYFIKLFKFRNPKG